MMEPPRHRGPLAAAADPRVTVRVVRGVTAAALASVCEARSCDRRPRCYRLKHRTQIGNLGTLAQDYRARVCPACACAVRCGLHGSKVSRSANHRRMVRGGDVR